VTDSVVGSPSPFVRDPIVSYSQNAEDVRLWRVFAAVENGFYVDIGAADPTVGSVTRLFYEHGWSGINVEPAPSFAALNEQRPRDVNIRAAVGASEGTVPFSLTYPDLGMSTLDISTHSHVLDAIERVVEVAVPQHRLEGILHEHATGRTIHFLKIDVEGAEGEVLASSDWEVFRPIVVIVEAIEPWTANRTHENWEGVLTEAGYEFAAFDGINHFYVDRAHQQLIPALTYPISALDRFVTAELRDVHDELRARQAELEGLQRDASRLRKDASRLRKDASLLRDEIKRLQAELAGVYGSRIWRLGMGIATAANPLLNVTSRLRQLPAAAPSRAYASAVARRRAWHFPRGGPAVSDRKFESLIALFGANDTPVTLARAEKLAEELNRIGWLEDESLLRRTFSWAERQALLEADAIVRQCSRRSKPERALF
jgi:FkbM family methyltransferase